jgi:nucleoside-diphosphate-sugar epimerase
LYEAYNVCSSQPTRIREVGEVVADTLQKPRDLLQWGRRQYRTDEPMWLVGDNRRFVRATSWRPAVSLEDGIRRIISSGRFSQARIGHQHAI